jgi:AcrR family transcriptional regulator
VAHGTFYRYFTDRGAAMEAVSRHLRATHGLDVENLRDDVENAAAAAVQLRSWMVQKMRIAQERPGLVRTFTALALVEPRLASYRNERRESTLRRMREHFSVLAARGLAPIDDPAALAHALFALIDGVYRETVLDGNPLEESQIAAAATIVERAVFARDVSA